jgi:hypothetical protein
VATSGDNDRLYDLRSRYVDEFLGRLSPADLADPATPAIINSVVDQDLGLADGPTPSDRPDAGLSDLLGLGQSAPARLAEVDVSTGVVDYDDELTSDRILSTANLYYLYMNERIGVFQVISKLQELFRAGTLRISDGPGALGLYRFDKHARLRYCWLDRMRAYLRVFGYTKIDPGPNARTNLAFHGLFTHFIAEVAKFWRDKRVSEVIRTNATDPTFGSIAIVRRAGLDLRNNVKNSSYGYINVLRVETQQALDEAFTVLEAADLRAQFGAESAWDLIELVMWQYFGRAVNASTMNRMATAGRDVLAWLAEPYILDPARYDFETKLYSIAESAEEWLSSEHGLRMTRPTPPPRNTYVPPVPAPTSGRQTVRGAAGRAVAAFDTAGRAAVPPRGVRRPVHTSARPARRPNAPATR